MVMKDTTPLTPRNAVVKLYFLNVNKSTQLCSTGVYFTATTLCGEVITIASSGVSN